MMTSCGPSLDTASKRPGSASVRAKTNANSNDHSRSDDSKPTVVATKQTESDKNSSTFFFHEMLKSTTLTKIDVTNSCYATL